MPRRRVYRSCLAFAATLAVTGAALAATDKQDFALIERGRYLTVLGDCAACHTQVGSTDNLAGGRPIETPFGNVLASNITPDSATGIGTWTDDEFVTAMTQGITPGGRHLYPAMPYTYFTRMTRDDLLAMRAYLRTLPAVRNRVDENQLSFPYNIRAGMSVWNALFFQEGSYKPVAGRSAEWNRGAYLVEGPMHCGMCHTPKNFLGGDSDSDHLKGYSLQGWFAPDITNAQHRGLGRWSVDDITRYLKTGHNGYTLASGPMSEVIRDSSSQASDADLHAIAVYLKDQEGSETAPARIDVSDPAMKVGAAIYNDVCSACHKPDGTGIPGLFPALSGSPAVVSAEPTSLIHVIVKGTRSVATAAAPTAPAMPAFGSLLSDSQVAAVATFIRNAWSNTAPAVTADQVHDWRDAYGRQSSTP